MIITVNFELFFYFLDSYPVRFFHPLDNEHFSYSCTICQGLILLFSSPPLLILFPHLSYSPCPLLFSLFTSHLFISSVLLIPSHHIWPPPLNSLLSFHSSSIYISSVFFFSSSIPFHTLRLIFNA